LIVKNRAAFEMRYGAGLPVAGEYSGQLNNAGERIQALGGRGETVLDVAYGTLAPWPQAADGTGPSLEVVDPSADLNSPANWRASLEAGGSPGKPNPGPPLRLELITIEAGEMWLRFNEDADSNYTVYGRESLSAGEWKVLLRGQRASKDRPISVPMDLSTSPSALFIRLSVP
jgi:hypothetical protein